MYSAEITRNGNLYRLELESSGTGDVNILAGGLSVTYEQQEIDKRYQPSFRGSLRCDITYTQRLSSITGCVLYKNGAVIFRGILNNLDEKRQLNEQVNYIYNIEFGDKLTEFDIYNIAGDYFLNEDTSGTVLQSFYRRANRTLYEVFQRKISTNFVPIIKSRIKLQIDKEDLSGFVTTDLNDWVSYTFFDFKAYFNEGSTGLEALEDIAKSLGLKAFVFGDQLYLIEEKESNYTTNLVIDSLLLGDSLIYNTIEPKYESKLKLTNDKQNISLNESAKCLNVSGDNGYLGIFTSSTKANQLAYIQGRFYTGDNNIQINASAFNTVDKVDSYFGQEEPFDFNIELQLTYRPLLGGEKSYSAKILLGYVDSNGHHFFLNVLNNSWTYRGQYSFNSDPLVTLNNVYTPDFFTTQLTVNNDNDLLRFSGQLQTTVNTTLLQARQGVAGFTDYGGSYYLFMNEINESGSNEVAYYTINDFSFNSTLGKYTGFAASLDSESEDIEFNSINENDNVVIEKTANNKHVSFQSGGGGLIGATDGATGSIKVLPYYWGVLDPPQSYGISIGFNFTGGTTFNTSLDKSMIDEYNTHQGIENDIIECDILSEYIDPLTRIELNGNSYFPTNIESNLEEGITRVTMINLL